MKNSYPCFEKPSFLISLNSSSGILNPLSYDTLTKCSLPGSFPPIFCILLLFLSLSANPHKSKMGQNINSDPSNGITNAVPEYAPPYWIVKM